MTKENAMDYGSDSMARFSGVEKRTRRWGALFVRSGLILFFISTLFARPALSQSQDPKAPSAPAMPTWTVQPVDAPKYFTNMTDRSLAFKTNDTPCAAYGGDGLYYACLNPSTDTWEITLVDPSIGVGQYAALAFYADISTHQTNAYISYYDANNGTLKLAYTFSGAWHYLTVPTPPPAFAPAENAADEQPVPSDDIDFTANLQQIQTPWLSILQQNAPDINLLSTGVGKYTSIDVNSHGIYISYYDDRKGPGGLETNNLNFAHTTDLVSWEFDVVDDPGNDGAVGLWSSIKVDYNGNAHIAYMSEKYDNLKYAFWNHNKDSWTVVDVDGQDPFTHVGSMCSIALYDPAPHTDNTVGVPYISYLDFDGSPGGNLKLARLNDLKTNSWTKKTIDSTGITGWWTSIVVNSDKKFFISYYLAYSNKNQGDLKFATGKIDGSWTVYNLRPGEGMEGQFTSIALNPDGGLPAILNYNASYGRMQYTYFYTSTKWDTRYIDYDGHDVGYASSLALTTSGFPHISYLDITLSAQKFARSGGTSFLRSYPFDPTHTGLYSSIDLYSGFPSIATYDTDDFDLLFARMTDTGWKYQTVQDTFDVGQYVSLKLDSSGNPHVSYYDATNKNLIYATWNVGATRWLTDVVANTGDVGKFSSLALSSTGRPYISYYDESNNSLRMAYKSILGIWTDQLVDDGDTGGATPDKVGWYSSIDVDSTDNPYISYYDVTTGDLRFASKIGPSTWLVETLDPLSIAKDVGLFTSLKIDRNTNIRHICYYDKSDGDLRYAQYSGGVWDYATVYSDGDVGYSCSIDLTGAGQPAISFYDNSRGDLLLATSYTIPPLIFNYLPLIRRP
jgi:hypothetical protein